MSLTTDPNAPSDAPPWGVPATIAWVLFAFLASTIVATVIFAAWQADRANLRELTYDGVVITVGALTSIPVQIAILAFAARLRGWTPGQYLALSLPKRPEIVFAAGCTAALMIVFDLLMFVTGRELVPAFQVEAYQTARDAGWLLGLLLAIVVIAPIGEEIAFRGFLFRGLVRPGYEKVAIVFISLAWALLHIQYDWLGMAQIFTAGLVLGWFRWASGSTTLTIIMHMLINAEAMLETALRAEFWP
ncbi:MAG: CPBP family intramembrane metalloprotease [Alphaproteobacteria bacterium]|nr:CPBP family intramembrane metalloprotease [Alphaproteobacteria bacterium]